ncbi:hypothetical protein ARMGADRAFT_1092802 [Armillaria gallica]|uniref:Uncharacterized protein n=1 Tax=Armillaria gallica TaxID=47427 RepID=A0A2H3C9M3_ARMGA|nr:hypothetical protein ARMGADRAFT_1092802 [Armillaria gallica]
MPDVTFAYLALLALPASIIFGLAIFYFTKPCHQRQRSSHTCNFPLRQIALFDPHLPPVGRRDKISSHLSVSSIYSLTIPDNLIDTTRPATPPLIYRCPSLTESRAPIRPDFVQGSSRDLITRPDSPTLPRPEAVLVPPPHLRNLIIPPPPTYPPPRPPTDI